MIVSSFGRYLPRTAHDHGTATSPRRREVPYLARSAASPGISMRTSRSTGSLQPGLGD